MTLPILLLAASAAVAFAQPGSPEVIAIRNARIHTGTGSVIAGGTVVIRHGLFAEVGKTVAIPPEAWVVEGEGLRVYPGLIDAMSRWGTLPGGAPVVATPAPSPPPVGPPGPPPLEQGFQSLEEGGPEDRPSNTSWLRAADRIDPKAGSITVAREAGYTTAFVFPNENIFAGQGAAVNLAGVRAGQMILGGPLGLVLTFPQRGFGSPYPASLMGMIAYVRQIFLDAAHYKTAQALYTQNARGIPRPAYDLALEGVLAAPRILLPANRAVEVDRMIRFGKELLQPFVIYGGEEAYRVAGRIAAAKVPVLISLKWPERLPDSDPDAREPLRVLETRDQSPSGPALLAKAGGKFAFYSGGLTKPAELRKAIRRAIDAGLSSEDALKALTLYPAQIFGLDDRLGSIEPGKIANLTVLDGDLFDEKSKLKFVVIDGARIEPAPATEAVR